MIYYACDPGSGEMCACTDLDEAINICTQWLGDYRDACDPEWPMSVEDVAVIAAPEVIAKDLVEDIGQVVAKAVECDRRELDAEDREACGVEYMCDYRMEKV